MLNAELFLQELMMAPCLSERSVASLPPRGDEKFFDSSLITQNSSLFSDENLL